MKPFAIRSHQEMKDVLMNQGSVGPEAYYYMMRGGSEKGNITVWESGLVGEEYIKTYGHYHVGDLEETYTILEGEGVVLLQEREIDSDGNPIDDEIKSFSAIYARAGDKVHIASNMGHLAVNVGPNWLVTRDDSPVNFSDADPVSLPGHADYSPFKKLRGAAYYVVSRNGSPELIKNHLYKKVPDAKIENMN